MKSPTMSENIIREILLRLPVESLVRFRTVERAWNNMILDDKFVQDHLNYNSNDKRGEYNCIVVNKDQELAIVSDAEEKIVCPHEDLDFELVGSIRGVVCLRHAKRFSLWNPAMRKSVEFSLPLAQDSGHLNNVGLCYDHRTSDFKLIVCYKTFDASYGILYSSRENVWVNTTGCDDLAANDSSQTAPSAMVNDCPYWTNYSIQNQFVSMSVIKFDAGIRKFKALPQFRAYKIDDGGANYRLVNLNDRLTILTCENKKRTAPIIDVFCLDEKDSGVWNPIYKIGPVDFKERCMWSLSQGLRFGNVLLFKEPGGYFFYDIKLKKLKFLRGSADYVINCYPWGCLAELKISVSCLK